MLVFPRRSILWLLVLGVVTIAIAGFSGEAAAEVFQGPLAITSPTVVTATMTVTLHPGGPATYTVTTLQGVLVDTGFLVASVNGSSVDGYIQTTRFANIRPCFFHGTLNGPTADLTADPGTCGLTATLNLTRIS